MIPLYRWKTTVLAGAGLCAANVFATQVVVDSRIPADLILMKFVGSGHSIRTLGISGHETQPPSIDLQEGRYTVFVEVHGAKSQRSGGAGERVDAFGLVGAIRVPPAVGTGSSPRLELTPRRLGNQPIRWMSEDALQDAFSEVLRARAARGPVRTRQSTLRPPRAPTRNTASQKAQAGATRRTALTGGRGVDNESGSVPTVSLTEGLKRGLFQLQILGQGLQKATIVFSPRSSSPLQVMVPAGTLLKPDSNDLQTMVVRKSSTIELDGRPKQYAELDVACAEMEKRAPEGSDQLDLESKPCPPELQRLLGLPAFHEEEFRIQQFAIWILTDDPQEDGFVGLAEWPHPAIAARGPGQHELLQIRRLFRAAGLRDSRYDAFRDLPNID